MTLRKTKVICTLGPAVDDEELIRKLIRAGMDAARFNFSHGDHRDLHSFPTRRLPIWAKGANHFCFSQSHTILPPTGI